jgi:hypothetical protein
MSVITSLVGSIAELLADNSTLRSWCISRYGHPHMVYQGLDSRSLPPRECYPFIALVPIERREGSEMNDNVIGITCGIVQELLEGRCLSTPSVVEGTNQSTISFDTFSYVVDWQNVDSDSIRVKVESDNVPMTSLPAQGSSTSCYYLLSVDAAGAIAVTRGEEVSSGQLPALPALPPHSAPMATILVTTDGIHTFTSGTTDLSAPGITSIITDWRINLIRYLGPEEVEAFRQMTISAIDSAVASENLTLSQDDISYEVVDLVPEYLIDSRVTLSEPTEFEGW